MKTIFEKRPVRDAVTFATRTWRRGTSAQRALPGAIILGAQKCGTKSLFYYLRQHPDLFGSCPKEVHYFDGGLKPDIDTYAMGEAWYRSHFALRSQMHEGSIAFEASPMYVFHPLAPQRIAKTVPDAKLIILLRDPVRRAISQYQHNRAKSKEPLSIAEAIAAEEARLAGCGAEGRYKEEAFNRFSYRARGRYLEQIRRYLEWFDREQILILHTARLGAAPHETLDQVFRFLGVDPSFQVEDLSRRNVSAAPSDAPDSLIRELYAYFEPHNAELFEFLGEDLGWNAAV